MFRLHCKFVAKCFLLWLLFSLVANFTWAQSETATVSGQVVDPSGLSVTGAQVKLVDIDRDTSTNVATNNIGLYTFPTVRPGRYRMEVVAAGFKVVNVTGVTVNVQDHLQQNFRLQIGSVAESVTVEASAATINTEDATVSTVVDRQFAENLPLNGRSFQTLIELTPGVVLTTSTTYDSGQFSINGQRADANYWMVDGVSANIGVSAVFSPGNGFAGSLGSFSAQGGTNSLVSVDALQEFRIQTSTYAPEFGRTPGGQISIVTRSGTNQYHGTAFDYLRNDVLDANDWFADNARLPKPEERQNDFGGTLSGPISMGRTFFFFSYEGLRLRLPQVALTTVPDLAARQNAIPAMQPFLNAYPLPNGPEVLNGMGNETGAADLDASYSNRSTLDDYSIRLDHRVNNKVSLFGRYNYSPSGTVQRGYAGSYTLNTLFPVKIGTQTATLGLDWAISPVTANDFRLNYSKTNSFSYFSLDNFGGAAPLASLPLPSPYNGGNSQFVMNVPSLASGIIHSGANTGDIQRQVNVVDSLSAQKGSHSLKFGVDFRRLSPSYDPERYSQFVLFGSVPSAETGTLTFSDITAQSSATFQFHNLGVYAQDTWKAMPRLSLTYGLRWDVDFVPYTTSGPNITAVTGFNLNNLSNLGLAPTGTALYRTAYGNVAPRIGVAYQLSKSQQWQTVFRGGFGVFFDLATQELGGAIYNLSVSYPFGSSKFSSGGTFPLDPSNAAPDSITPPSAANPAQLAAFDPNLKLPYTLEWNVAIEQALGKEQTLSASYVGAEGKRLIQSASADAPNPNVAFAVLTSNSGSSYYNALQIQFQRRLTHGLQALGSYSLSHSIDDGSAGSAGSISNAYASSYSNRGPSDFDIRNALSLGASYEISAPRINAIANIISRGWSLQSIIQARSAPPVDIYSSNLSYSYSLGQYTAAIRPDVVSGQPLYLFGIQYPGGKAINPLAFTFPPTDPTTGAPLRQGDLGRNALRGFGATQWDFAIHRDFTIHESMKLQFRTEMFNVLNHPNFGAPVSDLSSPNFGLSTQMLGRSLDQVPGGGSFSALYQIGGPRSIQMALKLMF